MIITAWAQEHFQKLLLSSIMQRRSHIWTLLFIYCSKLIYNWLGKVENCIVVRWIKDLIWKSLTSDIKGEEPSSVLSAPRWKDCISNGMEGMHYCQWTSGKAPSMLQGRYSFSSTRVHSTHCVCCHFLVKFATCAWICLWNILLCDMFDVRWVYA